MADTKISALPASTTPLAGTEVLPIVQGGATVKVSVANLTAGRAISATQLTLTTGNLIVASGQGIDFSATPGTGTSELLSDYEEGTWTPDYSAWTTGANTNSALYTKIGRIVTVTLLANSGNNAGGQVITGLPFTSGTTGATLHLSLISSGATNAMAVVADNSTQISGIQAINFGASYWCMSVTYLV
jgi:hypothetical protein